MKQMKYTNNRGKVDRHAVLASVRLLTHLLLVSFTIMPSLAQSSGAEAKNTLLVQAEKALQRRKADAVLYNVTDTNRFYVNRPTTTRYDWALKGNKLCQKEQYEGGQWHKKVYDGKTEQEVIYAPGQKFGGAINEVKNAKVAMLLPTSASMYEGAYRITGVWLGDLLHDGTFTAQPGPTIKSLGQTVEVTGMDAKKRNYHLLLAPAHGWMCVQAKATSTDTDKRLHEDEYSVSQAERYGDIWLPTAARVAYYIKDGVEPRELFTEHSLRGNVVQVGNLPDDLFAFHSTPDGTVVLDFDTLHRYQVQHGQMVPVDQNFTRSNGLVWTFVLSAGAFIAGGLLLAFKFLRRKAAV